jgi:hypothetical protein
MNLGTFPFGTPQMQLVLWAACLWDGSVQTRPQARAQFRVALYHHQTDINHLLVSSRLYIDSLAPSDLRSGTTIYSATSFITLFRKCL